MTRGFTAWDIPSALVHHEPYGGLISCSRCGNDCREQYVVSRAGEAMHLGCCAAWINEMSPLAVARAGIGDGRMSEAVVATIGRFMRDARACGRHVHNAMPCPFVLAPIPLCGDCVSLGWYWRWDGGSGWTMEWEERAWE